MNVSDNDCRLYASSEKQGSLTIRIPTEGAELLHGVSKDWMAILVRSLMEGVELSSLVHKEYAQDVAKAAKEKSRGGEGAPCGDNLQGVRGGCKAAEEALRGSGRVAHTNLKPAGGDSTHKI